MNTTIKTYAIVILLSVVSSNLFSQTESLGQYIKIEKNASFITHKITIDFVPITKEAFQEAFQELIEAVDFNNEEEELEFIKRLQNLSKAGFFREEDFAKSFENVVRYMNNYLITKQY